MSKRSYSRPMKAVFVKLPDPLFHDLAQHAKTSALTRSEIIRSALTAYLLQDAQPFCASCADRAKRWTGIMQGPEDLSTNFKHLDGFGH